MSYKAILVDMFNLTYRKLKKSASYISTSNDVISYIDTELKPRLDKNGVLYLIFDPIPKSDLGISKNFKYQPVRQTINSDYKANRSYNQNVMDAVKMLKKYYTYRGEQIKICISSYFEADDYVEEILKLEPTGKVLLITNDGDWARYINDRVVMINKDFDNPYTKESYFAEYGTIPTIATVTLRKAIYGDKSDNIRGIKLNRKINFYTDLQAIISSNLIKISKENMSISDIENIFRNMSFASLISKKDKNCFENLAYTLMAVDNNNLMSSSNSGELSCWDTFLNNIRLIKSRCPNVKEFLFWHPENSSYNKLMDVTLGKINVNKNHKFKFGNIRKTK